MANGRLKTASFGPGFLGAILLFCGFAVVAWILFRFAAPTPTYEEKRAQERRDKAAAISAEATQKLYSGPKWIDKAKGTVQLPIDVAMDLVVNEYQTKAVGPSSVKVDDPYPYGLQMAAAPVNAKGPAAAPGTLPKAGAENKPAAAGSTSSPAPTASPRPASAQAVISPTPQMKP